MVVGNTARPSVGGRGKPPTAPASWMLGSARDLQRDQLGAYERAMRLFGGRPVRFRIGPPGVGFVFYAVFQPEDARRVLATDAARYDKRVPVIEEFKRVIGNGLITSDGERWRRDRRIVAPLFTRRRVATYTATMASAAARVVSRWAPAARRGGQVDLHDDAVHYTLDVLGSTVFGEDVEAMAALFRDTVPLLGQYATRRGLSPIRVPASWPTPANRRANRGLDRLFGTVDGLINKRRAGKLEGEDLLSLLLAARDPETGEALDDVTVRDQALTFLIAGHETTASSLALTLHLLGGHEDVQARVRREVADHRGGSPTGSGDVEALPYTTQVVNEALRLFPPGHTVVRRAREPAQISGYDVAAGQVVAVSVYGIHHNPAVWPDPHRFDPDRFAAGGHFLVQGEGARYAHLPFGGGPRGCIGQQLAMTEIVVAVAALIGSYRLEVPPGPPGIEVGASLRPRGPLPCRLRPL